MDSLRPARLSGLNNLCLIKVGFRGRLTTDSNHLGRLLGRERIGVNVGHGKHRLNPHLGARFYDPPSDFTPICYEKFSDFSMVPHVDRSF